MNGEDTALSFPEQHASPLDSMDTTEHANIPKFINAPQDRGLISAYTQYMGLLTPFMARASQPATNPAAAGVNMLTAAIVGASMGKIRRSIESMRQFNQHMAQATNEHNNTLEQYYGAMRDHAGDQKMMHLRLQELAGQRKDRLMQQAAASRDHNAVLRHLDEMEKYRDNLNLKRQQLEPEYIKKIAEIKQQLKDSTPKDFQLLNAINEQRKAEGLDPLDWKAYYDITHPPKVSRSAVMQEFDKWQADNPDGTLEDFKSAMAQATKEGQVAGTPEKGVKDPFEKERMWNRLPEDVKKAYKEMHKNDPYAEMFGDQGKQGGQPPKTGGGTKDPKIVQRIHELTDKYPPDQIRNFLKELNIDPAPYEDELK